MERESNASEGGKESDTLEVELLGLGGIARSQIKLADIPLQNRLHFACWANPFVSDSAILCLGPRCIDCESIVTLDETVAAGGSRCHHRRCKKCHCSRKALRTHFSKAGRIQEWDDMPHEKKLALIVENKDKGSGRGKRRKIIVHESAECKDKLKLSQDKPFLTKKQFLNYQSTFFLCLAQVYGGMIQVIQHQPRRYLSEVHSRVEIQIRLDGRRVVGRV